MSGLLQAVADNALVEATEYDAEAEELERKAATKRRLAEGLRALHAVASQYAKPSTLQLVKETAG